MASEPISQNAGASSSLSLFGTLTSWGESILGYAQDQINNFLGWEDLDVIDPDAEGAEKGAASGTEAYNQEERKKAWGTRTFHQYIGMDVTSLLSVPVWIMEPVTILQKMAEIMEYTELLDKADACDDQYERLAWVVAFCVTPFGAVERPWKPFNPILGETFELRVGNGVRYFAEQVSHHPPVGVAHAENEHFLYDIVSAPTTQFLGNSLDIFPYGRSRIKLRRSGDVFTLVPPNSKAHNIVIGSTWVDCYGPLYVYAPGSQGGAKCVLNFMPCGWFGGGRYEFSGFITDADGRNRIHLAGKWNSHCDMTPCGADGEPDAAIQPLRMWTCREKPEGDFYGFTHFAKAMNAVEGQLRPLPSDSRRRSDRAALQAGDSITAGSEKVRLEQAQRVERAERERRGDSWQPRWFARDDELELLPGEHDLDKVPAWRWVGDWNKLEQEAVAVTGEVLGTGFSPWQYPELHAQQEE